MLRTIKNLWINEFGTAVEANAIDEERFASFIASIGVSLKPEETAELFSKMDLDVDGKIDYIEWSRLLSTQSMLTRRFFLKSGYEQLGLLSALPMQTSFSHILPVLNDDETELLDLFMGKCWTQKRNSWGVGKQMLIDYTLFVERLDKIAERAAKHQVRIMIDAEQTYMQPAIDHFTRRLQQQHNKKLPIVFNTYQAYLKTAPAHVRNDLERCRRRYICSCCSFIVQIFTIC